MQVYNVLQTSLYAGSTQKKKKLIQSNGGIIHLETTMQSTREG